MPAAQSESRQAAQSPPTDGKNICGPAHTPKMAEIHIKILLNGIFKVYSVREFNQAVKI